MYAIIKSGSRQYQVRPESVISVNRLAQDAGTIFETDQVLLCDNDGADVQVGTPYVTGAKVKGTVLDHVRGEKVLIFKLKRRKNYRRTQGHRQELTRLRIDVIEVGGQTFGTMPTEAERAKQAAKAAGEAKPVAKATAKTGSKAKATDADEKPAAKAAPKAKATAAKRTPKKQSDSEE